MKKMFIILSVIALLLVVVIFAGMYKFNYLANQPGYDVDGNKVEPKNDINEVSFLCADGYRFTVAYNSIPDQTLAKNEIFFRTDKYANSLWQEQTASGTKYTGNDGFSFWQKGNEALVLKNDETIAKNCIPQKEVIQKSIRETIYFDPTHNQWKDEMGVCNTCTPENGFLAKGQIKNQPIVSWVEIRLKLKNELNQNPPVEEVRELFAREYSLDPEWFGTYVELKDEVFTITYASSKSLEYEFRKQNGALKSYYTVTEINF